MEIITGRLYHIKDEYFDRVNDKGLLINHENGHSRPSYLAIKDNNILWFIPLSTQVDKYKKIIDNKIKKYGKCNTIMIAPIGDKDVAILIQNAFPTIEKYISNEHIVNDKPLIITKGVSRLIINNFKSILRLKELGNNLFFTNIDKIKQMMLDDLK